MPDSDAPAPEARASSQPDFWNERFEAHDRLFGAVPDPFIADVLSSLPATAHVVDVGGGDGRNTLPLARAHGFDLTVLDFAASALDTAAAYATQHDVSFAALHADARTWSPQRTYDAAVVAFVQLLPHERSRLYTTLRDAVRPGGHIIGLWFRTDHAQPKYDRIGPSKSDRYVSIPTLQAAFASDTIHCCIPMDRYVEQGPVLRGQAALAHLHVQRQVE